MPGLGPKFYQKLMEISSSTGLSPEHILNVMASESGLDPAAGKGNSAAGLIQIMPQYLKSYGYHGSPDDFRKESPETQLIYVERVIKDAMKLNGGRPFKSATQYYVANFLPASLKLPGVQQEDPNTIIAAQEPTEPHIPGQTIEFEKKVYKSNSGLDVNHDGKITYGDLEAQLARVAKRVPYQTAINDLKTHTGYEPNKTSPSMLAQSPKGRTMETNQPDRSQSTITTTPAINDLLESFLQEIRASEKRDRKIYKKFLPTQHILIQVGSRDPIDAIEFSRILSTALDEELLARAHTYVENDKVEIECEIPGPSDICFETVQQLTQSLVDVFKQATKKIGGIEVKTNVIMNKKSSYQQMSSKSAELNYRKFMFKFS